MTENYDSNKKKSRMSSQKYIVITAFLSLFSIVGIAYYGLPFFFDFMASDFSWSRTTITSGNALGKLLVGPLFGFVAGWMIDRYGPRKLMLTGSALMCAALVGLGYTNGNLSLFYLFYVFNALGYVCAGPLPCQVLISRWFDRNRGKAMGIAYLGIGAGGALAPILASTIEKQYCWNFSLASLGIIALLICVPLVLFIREPSKDETFKKDPAPQIPIKKILANKNFYLLGLGSMCAIGVVGGVGQHLKLYLRDINFSQSEAANVMSLVLLMSLAGRVLMGWLADLISRKYVMILIYLLVATAIPLLLIPVFPGRIYLFAIIYGIGLGGDYMIIPLMAGDLFGVKALGRTMGIILVADGVSEALFPLLAGALYNEAAKSYAISFSVLIGVALLGTLIISFLPKKGQNIIHVPTF
jgi:MFS family permease